MSKIMNTKKLLVSGLFILSIVSLMGLTAATPTNSWPGSSANAGPINIYTGGTGIAAGSVTYSPSTNTNLDPGAVILATVPVYNTNKQAQQLTLNIAPGVSSALTNPGYGPTTPNANDIASVTSALIWVSPSSIETSPQTGDYYLTTTGLVKLTGSNSASPIQLSDTLTTTTSAGNTLPLPSTALLATPYTVYCQLTISSTATANAEDQTLSVPITLIGNA